MDRDLVAATREEFERRGISSRRQVAVATEVERLNRLIQAAAQPYLLESDLTYAGWQALLALSFSKEKALPTAKLAARVGSHPTTLTRTIDRLVRTGLVQRVAKEGDRRVNIVEILPAGEAAQEEVLAKLDESRFGMGDISAAALDKLVDLLDQLRLAMAAAVD